MRIRNVRPGFFKNDDLAQLDFHVRLLFIGLWMMADRDGKLLDKPLRIQAEIFPYDNKDVIQIDGALDSLAENGFITRYERDGVNCILVNNFRKHQVLSGNERKTRSSLPNPLCESGRNDTNSDQVMTSHDSVCTESGPVGTNHADIGRRTQDIGRRIEDTSHPRAREASPGDGGTLAGLDVDELVRRVRDAHPCCERISEMALVSAVRLYVPAIGASGVDSALSAFERHMSGAASHANPMQKFENYLKKEAAGSGEGGAKGDPPERQVYRRQFGGKAKEELGKVWDSVVEEAKEVS